MLTFSYKARDPAGNQVSGTLEARSQSDVVRTLQREGKVVTEVLLGARPAVDASQVLVRQAARTVRRDEVIGMANQLAVMLDTGVPLAEALEAYLDQLRPGPMKRVMGVLTDRIHAGVPFSEAMRQFPRVFPTLMVSLIRASEASGKLGLMLARVAGYLSKERRTIKQIKGAMTYPLVMVSLATVVTLFLVMWVLPRFARIYESRSAALPTPTRIVLGVSEFLLAHWVPVVAGIAAVVGGTLGLRMMRSGRRLIDRAKISLPVLGRMYTMFYLTRATRTLGTLLAAGVPLLDAVRIVRGVTENVLWDELWDTVDKAMTVGRPISEAFARSAIVPRSVSQMIAAGERSGRLPDVLERIGQSSEEDLDEAVKAATQLIEPVMIIFMGTTIGGIAISLLLPIFSVANTMAK
ncbi:MAG: type II secretion system F family protein [Phycisphaerales bacterium]|nr:type II secretion system F family protein [Phycisphaerales bacterium]